MLPENSIPRRQIPGKSRGEVPVSPSPSRIKPAVSAAVPLEVRESHGKMEETNGRCRQRPAAQRGFFYEQNHYHQPSVRQRRPRAISEWAAAYYDQEIIIEISKRTRLSEQYIQNVMEKRPYIAYPITVAHSFSLPANDINFQMNLEIFQTQKQIIEEMARKIRLYFCRKVRGLHSPATREPFRIFVYADMDSRIERCRQRALCGGAPLRPGDPAQYRTDRPQPRKVLQLSIPTRMGRQGQLRHVP